MTITMQELFELRAKGGTLGGGSELAIPKPGKKKKSSKKKVISKPKQKRSRLIDDKSLKKYGKENPDCEWCAWELKRNPNYIIKCTAPTTNPHHIKYKSQGGPDIPENFVTLWNHHHDLAHKLGPKARAFIFKELKGINQNLIVCWNPEIGIIKIDK